MEVEIGLGVPRDPVRVVLKDGAPRMVQPATGLDLTGRADSFAEGYLSGIKDIDGFILKSRSPSCGTRDVKVYPPGEKVAALTTKGSGFFGRPVMARFPHLAVEDEMRLTNLRIGEHFLTRVFSFAELREVMERRSMSALVDLQSRYKMLLMHYNQKELRTLGNIVANRDGRPTEEVLSEYSERFHMALSRPPRCGSGVNMMMHAFGYFSKDLNLEEREIFLGALKGYSEGKLPMTVPLGLIRSLAARFDSDYIRKQRFLDPFPEEFLELMSNDTCLGREL